jgi:protein SCO1/2
LAWLSVSCHQKPKQNEVVLNENELPSRTATLPFYNDPSFTPQWIEEGDTKLLGFHQIPAFSLENQLGETITEQNLNGKIVVADFFFTTCPGICPKMTRNMQLVQKAFESDPDVLLVSHSVTPEIDNAEVLKKYAGNHDVLSGKWHLLTGEREVIYSLGRQSYFVEEDLGLPKNEMDFLHTENFILLDKKRRIRGIYNGLNKRSVLQLITDIKSLKTSG